MKPFLTLIFWALCTGLFAQPGKFKERIKAQRVAFITERLALSADEAQKFWPVYNQFTAELEEIKKGQTDLRKTTYDKLAVLGDREIDKALEDELSSQQRIIDLQRKYHAELKKVIPVRKVAMLYKAERDFKLSLLKKIRESGQKAPPGEDEF